MKKTHILINKAGVKLLEAGMFFMVLATPSVAGAQSLQDGVRDARPTGVDDGTGLMDIFSTIANILLFILGAVAVIMLIVGGFRYVVSGGDSNAVEGAKNTILYAIVGIVVAFLAWAAVDFVVDSLVDGQATPASGDENGDEN